MLVINDLLSFYIGLHSLNDFKQKCDKICHRERCVEDFCKSTDKVETNKDNKNIKKIKK